MSYNELAAFFMFSLSVSCVLILIAGEIIKRISSKRHPRVFALTIAIFLIVCIYAEITVIVTSTLSGGFHNRYLHERIENPTYERAMLDE